MFTFWLFLYIRKSYIFLTTMVTVLLLFNLFSVLQKAGRHMEHTLIGAYIALLLGYLIVENQVIITAYISKVFICFSFIPFYL